MLFIIYIHSLNLSYICIFNNYVITIEKNINIDIVPIIANNCQTPEGNKNIDTIPITTEILVTRYDKYAIHAIIDIFSLGSDKNLK